ncbi:MAG: DNA repair protein RecN [Streptococcaceae bacterium]|jgi:DNA repair protein RecN (Recombination protein N)|nr:DNA repair protein RecN [Streptococcaceae bacterium]
MLQELSIRNFAIIEEVSLNFDMGMTVLTGETGAGKSIIIDAMNLLLGERASTDFVRHGTDKAEIEALFFIKSNSDLEAKMTELGLTPSSELILRREIFANGRSVCRVNGQMVNLTGLRTISEYLIDIHGQHDNQELMNAKHHLAMLDEFGDAEFNALKSNYQQLFEHYRKARAALTERKENEKKFAERIDMLQFQVDEIEAAGIDLEKDEDLPQRRDKLNNVKFIADNLNQAYQLLDGEDETEEASASAILQEVIGRLDEAADFDEDYQVWSDKIQEAFSLIEDVSAGLDNTMSSLEFNPTELTQLEERIYTLTALKRKYGPDLTDVLDFYEKSQRELSSLTGETTDLHSLEHAVIETQKELLASADKLNKARHKIAESLEADIKQELADLYMEKADFKVKFEPAKFSLRGNESVEFYIQTNPGEGFKPLAKTASGGELSRLMLAIKSSFARQEHKTSIVFDEVDTGVSGRVAQAIAQKIYKISQAGQVLAISHLPQVVAIADVQFYIEKSSNNDVTTSTVRKLNQNERVEEIAKMLAGDDLTPEALAQAKKLLKK